MTTAADSLILPSIFVDPKQEPRTPTLAFMSACSALRRAAPDADTPCSSDCEIDAAGSWVLRNLHHEPIATVTRTGDVQLAQVVPLPKATLVAKAAAQRSTPGIVVTEGTMASRSAVLFKAELTTWTYWRCASCKSGFKKRGSHLSTYHTCKSCGTGGWLAAVS